MTICPSTAIVRENNIKRWFNTAKWIVLRFSADQLNKWISHPTYLNLDFQTIKKPVTVKMTLKFISGPLENKVGFLWIVKRDIEQCIRELNSGRIRTSLLINQPENDFDGNFWWIFHLIAEEGNDIIFPPMWIRQVLNVKNFVHPFAIILLFKVPLSLILWYWLLKLFDSHAPICVY